MGAHRGTARPRPRRGMKRLVGLRRRERPLAEAMGTEEIDDRAADCDSDGSIKFEEAAAPFCVGAARVEEHEGEAGHGNERRERIERNSEGTREIGMADAEQDHAYLLQRKLEQDARNNEHGDDLRKREEAEERSDEAKSDEGAVGNSVARVDCREEAEVVAVAGGGVGDTRVAEEQ